MTFRTTRHRGAASGPVGLVLLRAAVRPVADWARRGVVPVRVVGLGEWTAVVPSGASRAAAPYDEPLPVLAARSVPHRLCPALGFFVIDDRAVVTVHTSGWRRSTRWVLWEPASAVLAAPGLALAGPVDLTRAAGVAGPSAQREVRQLLRSRHRAPVALLSALLETLELPGAPLLGDPTAAAMHEVAQTVEPAEGQVALFDDAVRDAVLLRRELEVDR